MSRLAKIKFNELYRSTNGRVSDMISKGRYYYLRPMSSAPDPRVTVRGKEYIMFGSNNYLGLAAHPKVTEAAIRAIKKYGAGSGGSRVSTGNTDIHDELEAAIAQLKGKGSAAVFNSGFLTNLGVIAALCDKETVIFSDKKNHASIIDGCELSKAKVEYFEHGDMASLEGAINRNISTERKLLVTDGIFSMDGDLAKLPEISELAKKYGVMTLVDDAHATGVLGSGGGGTAEHFGLAGMIDYEIGTLSKAIGGGGGFIAADKDTVTFIKHASRQFIFSTALPPASAAAALAAVALIREEPERREALRKRSEYMRGQLKKMGFNTGLSETQIIPVMIGNDDKAYSLTRTMEENGIYVLPAVYPVVRKKDSRIRLSVLATHEWADLDKTLEVFNTAGKEMGLI